MADSVRKLADLEFTIHATRGTKEFLEGQGVLSELVLKFQEERPNIVNAIENGKIQLCLMCRSGGKERLMTATSGKLR